MRVVFWLAVFCVGFGAIGMTAAPARNDELSQRTETPSEADVAKWIKQLNADKFRRREHATHQLIQLGRKIQPLLHRALDKNPPLETRLRIQRILKLWTVTLHVYTDRKSFMATLKVPVRVITFDDVDTRKQNVVAISADRYQKKFGIRIFGTVGQYVSRTFSYPKHFRPQSPPNMYAPGPRGKKGSGRVDGGHNTTVTFFAKDKRAAVAAFGAYFIDADHPNTGPSQLAAYGARYEQLAKVERIHSGDGASVFRGIIAMDGHENLMPVISIVHLVNGNCWPEVDAGDGVALDDFVFSIPTTPVANH